MAGRFLIAHIVQAAEACTGVTLNQLRSRDQANPVVRVRHACMILASKYTDHSSTRIGRFFRRDHTTVLYVLGRGRLACNKHKITDSFVAQIDERLNSWAETGSLESDYHLTPTVTTLQPPPRQEAACVSV